MSVSFIRGENPLRADKLNTAFGERVLRSGDTMGGLLTLATDPISAFDAATKQYVDSRYTQIGPPGPQGPPGSATGSVIATGSTASRTLPDRFADWVNVKDFGAKIDGTTQDGPAVGAALATLQPNESLYFPGGTTVTTWGQAQGTTPATPVRFLVDGTINAGAPMLRAFQRNNKGDLFETFYNGSKILSVASGMVDHSSVLRVDYAIQAAGGGSGNVTLPVVVNASDNVGTITSLWGLHVDLNTYSNQTPLPNHVGISTNVHKHGKAWTAGYHATVDDNQNLPSLTGGTLVGMEIGFHTNDVDNAVNGDMWGSAGVRMAIHLTQTAMPSFGTYPAEYASGIHLSGDANSITKSVLSVGDTTRIYQMVDSRAALAPTGYASPVAAVRMSAGQVIDFNGGPALNSVASANTLKYDVASNALLVSGGLQVNGPITGTGIGWDIGDIPGPIVSSGGANLPMLNPNNRLVFRRQNPSVNDFVDFQFDRTTTYTGGTLAGNKNRVVSVTTTIGPNDGANNWNLVNITNNNSTVHGFGTSQFNQVVRGPGANGWITGGLFDTIDQTGLGTLASGVPNHLGLELDFEANGADDGVNTLTFGGNGVRKGIHFVGIRWNQADTTQTEFSTGLWFSTSDPTGANPIDPYTNFQQIIGFSPGTQVRSVVDTRGAVTPAGSANPVSAVVMSAGHVIDFNGGSALNSIGGNYLQYTTTGTARLRYMAGATEAWSVSNGGLASSIRLAATNPTVLAGAAIPVAALNIAGTVSGSSTITNDTSAAQVSISTSALSASIPSGTWNQMLVATNIAPGFNGNFIGIHPNVTTTGAVTLTSQGAGAVLIGGRVQVAHNMGGVAAGFGSTQMGIGAFQAANPRVNIASGASYIYAAVGQEIGVAVNCPTVSRVAGLQVVLESNHDQHAVYREVGYMLSAQGGAAARLYNGFLIGEYASQWPIDDNGYIMQAIRGTNDATVPAIAAGGIDFNQPTFSGTGPLGGGFAWRSPGVQILAESAAQIGGGRIDGSTGGLLIDTPWRQLSGTPTVSAGGTGYEQGATLGDANGNVVRVNVTAGVVTSVASVIRRGWSQAAPATAAFSFISSPTALVGTGLVLNLAWTAVGGVTLGSSGSRIGMYGATPVVKQTGVAVTAAAIHAALTNLGLIAP